MKKVLSVIMSVIMILSCMSISVFAKDSTYSRTEPKKLANHFYEVEYDKWNTEKANEIAQFLAKRKEDAEHTGTPYELNEYYAKAGVWDSLIESVSAFSCTSCRTGNLIGRNFDWAYDDVDEYLIRVPAANGRHASIGVASAFFPEFIQDIIGVEDIIPMLTMDGINDAGVAINVNVVASGSFGDTYGTNEGGTPVCAGFAVRYILDNATSAANAVELLKAANIFSVTAQEFHWMISDASETYIAECVNNNLVVLKAKTNAAMSNFHVTHSPRLADYDIVWPASSAKQSELTGTEYSPLALGIERYAKVWENMNTGITSEEAMLDNMQQVRYKLAYKEGGEWLWSDMNMHMTSDKSHMFVYGDDDDWAAARMKLFAENREKLKSVTEREKLIGNRVAADELANGVVHTVHTSVYNIENKTLLVNVQERNTAFKFNFTDDVFTGLSQLYVNGDNVGVAKECCVDGESWTYDSVNKVLNITGNGTYVIEGLEGSGVELKGADNATIKTLLDVKLDLIRDMYSTIGTEMNFKLKLIVSKAICELKNAKNIDDVRIIRFNAMTDINDELSGCKCILCQLLCTLLEKLGLDCVFYRICEMLENIINTAFMFVADIIIK